MRRHEQRLPGRREAEKHGQRWFRGERSEALDQLQGLLNDAAREALCFGWIDSLIKRLDDDRYAVKMTPRRPTSKWSDINRRRWKELKAAGLLTSAGLAAAPSENTHGHRPVIPVLPNSIAKASYSASQFCQRPDAARWRQH